MGRERGKRRSDFRLEGGERARTSSAGSDVGSGAAREGGGRRGAVGGPHRSVREWGGMARATDGPLIDRLGLGFSEFVFYFSFLFFSIQKYK